MGTPGKCQAKPAASPKRSRCRFTPRRFCRSGPENCSSADVRQSTLLLPVDSALTARCVAAALLPLYLNS